MILRFPEWNTRLAVSLISNNFTNNSDRSLAAADGIVMILFPFPFERDGKSCTGKISILPAEVSATKSAVGFLIEIGVNTFAFSGKEINALPALLRATKSSNLQIKP